MTGMLPEWVMTYLVGFAYTLPRMLSLFLVLPMFNKQALPGLLRFGVAAALGLMLVPVLSGPAAQEERALSLILVIMLKESLLGFTMGFLFALPLWAFEAMGAMIDNQRGASIAQIINPMTGHDTSPLGDLYSQAMMVFLLVTGGFLSMLGAIYESFALWPVFSFWPRVDIGMVGFLLSQFDTLMRMAVLYGAPVIIAMFMAEMGLALVSRFAPQLQVFFLAMSIKSGLAMVMLALYTTLLFHYAEGLFIDFGKNVLESLTEVIGRVPR